MSWLNKENRIWYITIFLLLLAGLNYALNAWTYRTGVSLTGETFYWPFLLPRFLNFPLPSYWQAPLLLLLIGLYILWRQRQMILGAGFMLVAVVVFFFMFQSFVAADFEGYTHLQSVRLEEEVYHLGRSADWDGIGYYNLCRCDKWGMVCDCHRFYRVAGVAAISGQGRPADYTQLLAAEAEQAVLVQRYVHRTVFAEAETNRSPSFELTVHTLYRYQNDGVAACLPPPSPYLFGHCLGPP
jgi:hypothetical protein